MAMFESNVAGTHLKTQAQKSKFKLKARCNWEKSTNSEKDANALSVNALLYLKAF